MPAAGTPTILGMALFQLLEPHNSCVTSSAKFYRSLQPLCCRLGGAGGDCFPLPLLMGESDTAEEMVSAGKATIKDGTALGAAWGPVLLGARAT